MQYKTPKIQPIYIVLTTNNLHYFQLLHAMLLPTMSRGISLTCARSATAPPPGCLVFVPSRTCGKTQPSVDFIVKPSVSAIMEGAECVVTRKEVLRLQWNQLCSSAAVAVHWRWERFWNKLFSEPGDKRAGDDLFLKSSENSGTFIYTHNLRHSSTIVLVRSSVGSMWLWWFCKASSHSFNSFHRLVPFNRVLR